MKEKSKLEPFYKIGLVALIIVVVLFAIYEINYLREYKNIHDTFEEGKKKYQDIMNESGEKHKELLKENKDYVGWLNVSGTAIQYPMVQGEDNEKYLNIDFNGNVDSNGSIFVDSKVSNPFQDKVTVIHGSSKMLGDLTKFEDRQFFMTTEMEQ